MLRILAIDDEPALLSLITAELQADGHDVVPVSSAAGAMTALAGGRFDLIITDLGLGTDDKELMRRYRELSPQTKIIAFSGWLQGDSGELIQSWGVDGCLGKPASPADLQRVIGGLFPSSRDASAGS